ncbi:MAG: DUF1583 domain-containing protein [Planctomycetaceae bacterium]|nr:DUF1583 domain-containing protein [Planctomycetaceae bacterium]
MSLRCRLFQTLTGLFCLIILCSLPARAEVYEFDLTDKVDPRYFRVFGSQGSEQFTELTDEGVRIAITSTEENRVQPSGIISRFGLNGDFTITGTFKITEMEIPKRGYGAGAKMMLEEASGFCARLERINRPRYGEVFKAQLGVPAPPEPGDRDQNRRSFSQDHIPAKSKSGKLRLKREGDQLIWLAADGENETFQELRKENFSKGRITDLSLAGQTGLAAGMVELYWTHLTIEVDNLPEPELPAPEPESRPTETANNPTPQSTPTHNNINYWNWMIGAGIALLVGCIGYLIFKK